MAARYYHTRMPHEYLDIRFRQKKKNETENDTRFKRVCTSAL